MKRIWLISVLAFSLGVIANLNAQNTATTLPSPPAHVAADLGKAKVAIHYSSPAVKGRQIWGGLVPFNKIWRTGANAATTFETSSELYIQGQTLPAGKYALFTIPGESEWTIIFNSEWDQWGSFKYNEAKDVLRITAKPEPSPAFHERMKFDIADHVITLSWENLRVSFMAE